jgi:hypothetical protein
MATPFGHTVALFAWLASMLQKLAYVRGARASEHLPHKQRSDYVN